MNPMRWIFGLSFTGAAVLAAMKLAGVANVSWLYIGLMLVIGVLFRSVQRVVVPIILTGCLLVAVLWWTGQLAPVVAWIRASVAA